MLQEIVEYTRVLDIVGDVCRVRAGGVGLGDLAIIENIDGETSVAKVIGLNREVASLQVFAGGKGLSTDARVRFLPHGLRASYSNNILGRIFRGSGEPINGGPDLSAEPGIDVDGPTVNPMKRVMPSKMIETEVPMIDVFNCLVESQKIPIFSVAGEPFNALLARIGFQANADIVVFGGMGLIFDDFHFFKTEFESHGVFHRTVMYVNQASDPIVERLNIPDLALAVAERFAVEQGKRVLVLLTDMTAYADAMKEIGIAQERIPAARGYMGDLYTQLARRYEKACDFQGAGSVTILSVTTMPGGDLTHPVPDNTGYITEGQFYLHDGMVDPFGSLSRLKQKVVGKATREDHPQVMNTMIRLYAGAKEAENKQAMAFELTDYDRKLIKFGDLFRKRFMDVGVSLPLNDALDLCWKTMAECFAPEELLMKQALVAKYYPQPAAQAQSEQRAMAKPKLSKNALQQQRTQLRLYQKLLPSLDLKRRQLMTERKKAEDALGQARAAVDALEARIGGELPMLAETDIPLGGLVRMTGLRVRTENVAGVKVPRLDGIECAATPYSMLARPAWVDRLVERLKDAAEQRVRANISDERVRVLDRAVRRITQRVNLFERILIPGAKQNIKRIQIYLGDLDREAVIRSKLSKAKHGAPAVGTAPGDSA